MCTPKLHYIGFYEQGSTIAIPVDFITNGGPGIAVNIIADVDYPITLQYSSSTLSGGSYNDTTREWTIPSLVKGQSVNGIFYFTVLNDCISEFEFSLDVSSASSCVPCLSNASVCIRTYGISCCNTGSCMDPKIETISAASYTILTADKILEANASANAIQFNLPTAASAYNATTGRAKSFTIKVVDFTNGVSVVANGTEKILDNTNLAGATSTYNFGIVGESATFTSNGTYYIVT